MSFYSRVKRFQSGFPFRVVTVYTGVIKALESPVLIPLSAPHISQDKLNYSQPKKLVFLQLELYQIFIEFSFTLQQTEQWTEWSTKSISVFVDRYFNFWLVEFEIKQKQ